MLQTDRLAAVCGTLAYTRRDYAWEVGRSEHFSNDNRQ